ncbi:MAG: ERF family protein [Candidatus Velthaea sp.]
MGELIDQRIIETSPTVAKIAGALILAQANMGPLLKSKTNPAFKSRYADLEAVLDVASPALHAVGILPIQAPGGDGTTVGVETLFIHAESGEWIRSRLWLKPTKSDPQGAGSAITYGRRYAMQAMCNLAGEDDDGNAASKSPRQTPELPASAPEPTKQEKIAAELAALGRRWLASGGDGAPVTFREAMTEAGHTSLRAIREAVEAQEAAHAAAPPPAPSPARKSGISEATRGKIFALAKEAGFEAESDRHELQERLGLPDSISKFSPADADKMISALEGMIA